MLENEQETTESQTAAGAGSNGNDSVVDGAGSEASRQSQQADRIWTQAEVEALIRTRLEEATKRQDKEREKVAREARLDEAKKSGNLAMVLSERDTELAQARQELADLQAANKKAELDGIKARVAAKHFPDRKLEEITVIAERLLGANELEIDSDAANLRRLLGPRGAPDNQAGAGGRGGPTDKELQTIEKQAALDSGRYGSY